MLKGNWFANLLLPNTAKNQRGNGERKIITSLTINVTGILQCKVPMTEMHLNQDSFLFLVLRKEQQRRENSCVRKIGHRVQALDPCPLPFSENCLVCDLLGPDILGKISL